jgi:hypothetical protein
LIKIDLKNIFFLEYNYLMPRPKVALTPEQILEKIERRRYKLNSPRRSQDLVVE